VESKSSQAPRKETNLLLPLIHQAIRLLDYDYAPKITCTPNVPSIETDTKHGVYIHAYTNTNTNQYASYQVSIP